MQATGTWPPTRVSEAHDVLLSREGSADADECWGVRAALGAHFLGETAVEGCSS